MAAGVDDRGAQVRGGVEGGRNDVVEAGVEGWSGCCDQSTRPVAGAAMVQYLRFSSALLTSSTSWRASGGCRGRLRVVLADHPEQPAGVLGAERRPAAEHLVERGPQREDVGARVDRLPADLLGGHVARGAQHGPRLCRLCDGGGHHRGDRRDRRRRRT